ncbi:MAG: ribosome silencing factor [Propionibacteriaceae bacterium]|nr:ribosome silencing factor [Propionibacteriaceae bacterium]
MSATADSIAKANTIANAAAAKLGRDIQIIDVSDQLAIADIFVIVSGDSERQVDAVVDNVLEELLRADVKVLRREGRAGARWVLLDYGDIVVHVMHAEERAYYGLERIWKDCPLLPTPPDVPALLEATA